MDAFRYEALDARGRKVSGVVEADTPRQARTQLRVRGLFPSTVTSVRSAEFSQHAWVRGISANELGLVTRQLSVLLASGLTIEQSLSALIDEAIDSKTQRVLSGVKTEVIAGNSLANALSVYRKSFPEYYCALVRGGEESGALATVLGHLADYLESSQTLKQKISLALLYPALVTVVAIAIVTGLLIYVVPQVAQAFQQSHQTLPWLTRSLIAFSAFLQEAWPYILVLVGGGSILARRMLESKPKKRQWHAFLLTLPGLGPLIRGANAARFSSTLAILLEGGVPLLTALTSSARVMSSIVLSEAVGHAIERVREGASLAHALGATRSFPPLLVHLVSSGEVSGKLHQMLKRAAQLETQSLERRLALLVTLVEPVMILVMGGIVLLIVLAILLPIIEINQLVR